MVYIAGGAENEGCIFCPDASIDRRQALILAELPAAIVMLNRFPYTSGHLLVAPRRHAGDPAQLSAEEFSALAGVLRDSIRQIGEELEPQGINVGMNLGRAAGAGIEDHIHWHVVPRWNGDTNFMPVMADVRVIPEHLEATYDRLLPRFRLLGC